MNNKKGIAAGLGLSAATLFAASNAEAATQLYQLAESDNRVGIIGLLFLPVLGWVGFNILQVCMVGGVYTDMQYWYIKQHTHTRSPPHSLHLTSSTT